MNEKNVLAILGSPHTNGTTAAMLNLAVHKAEQAGYAVTKINLYEKELSFCTGCRICMDTHICVQKDDIQEIALLLHKSQLVILAAPVYWANVPAPVKNLFDRLLGTAMEETDTFPKPRLRGKQYMILTSCNTPAPFSWIFGQSRGAIRSMDEFFKTAGMKRLGKVVCANAQNKKGLSKRITKKIERCLK
ncbi:MAG: flavodoxin family protein [Lachnospiraceae bacterium]|nr:flavodoxin family protein [Lachnospiraceae bacterium]MCM1234588.1 flavodoxin family protein [Ruminococcus flavefaciens]